MGLLVGQHLRRREPQGDDPWNEVIIRGFSEGGELVEPCISPRSFGETVAVDPGTLLKHYTLVAADDPVTDPVTDIAAGLEKLKATPWASEPGAPING